MNEDYSRTSYNGVASAIGVPVLIGGIAVGSLNLMYLRNSLGEADVVARFVAPLAGGGGRDRGRSLGDARRVTVRARS